MLLRGSQGSEGPAWQSDPRPHLEARTSKPAPRTEDPDPDEFRAAIGAFLRADESALTAASGPVFDYYQDVVADGGADGGELVHVAGPDDVWAHVHPTDVAVGRDVDGDRRVYVSVECDCDWEQEHGLQIVFRDGRTVTKIGPFDRHFTNASAFDRDDLEGVVYCSGR